MESMKSVEFRQTRACYTCLEDLLLILLQKASSQQAMSSQPTSSQPVASIDESMMTGEPYPVRKKDGEAVMAGTVVLDGSVFIRTTSLAGNTLLDEIVDLVHEAQMGKAPIQRLVDQVAGIFVPTVIVMATLAALFRTSATLLIACRTRPADRT